MNAWLNDNWALVAVPVLAFIATYIIGLWIRTAVNRALETWSARSKWEGSRLFKTAIGSRLLIWFLLLGVLIALEVSVLPTEVKAVSAKIVGSLFVLSIGWVVIVLSVGLLRMYLPMFRTPQATTALVVNVIRTALIVVGALIVLDIWGAPTTPLLILIAAIVLGAALALRNAATDLFAGFQIGSTQQIKPGDYIKLGTGEEGYVVGTTWNNTRIKGLDESIIVVPNTHLLQSTITNYGRPLKRAKEPFHFYSRTHITELTGLRAGNLRELVDILKRVPDSVVYFHTHHFLEQQHYLTPDPSNDFAVWIGDALGDAVLGERLASVDLFEFQTLGTLRERLVGIIEETIATSSYSREAAPGEEFHFMKSVSVVLPTSYFASDLREFVEILRKLSLGSLYYHIFESRLRVGMGLNDFSVWMQDSLGDPELGAEISRLDPYTYTLEGLRLTLIRLVEKRIK